MHNTKLPDPGLYDEGYFSGQERKSPAKVAWQYGRLLRAAGNLPRAARVLDLGCGAGPALPYLLKHGLDVWGSDFVRYPLQLARRKSPAAYLVCADAQVRLPFADSSFDLVLLSEVIEHVRDPLALAQELLRVLRYSGAVVLTTPNTWDVRRLYYPLLNKVWAGDADPTHIQLFSPRSMAILLRRAGFTTVRVRSGFKPIRFIKAGPLRAEIPYPPLIGNTLIAVATK